jgi:hypothetical protein
LGNLAGMTFDIDGNRKGKPKRPKKPKKLEFTDYLQERPTKGMD